MKGLIRDSETRTGISGALVQVEGILHPVRSVEHGAYWRLLLPGLHNITVTASGYQSKTVLNVNVTNANATSVRGPKERAGAASEERSFLGASSRF